MNIYKNKLIMIKNESFKYDKKISCNTDMVDFLREKIRIHEEPEKTMVLVGLDCKNNIVGISEIARGTIDNTITSPREILKRILLMNCKKFIIAYNNTTGEVKPSNDDINLNKKMKKASEFLFIDLLDTLIISDKKY